MCRHMVRGRLCLLLSPGASQTPRKPEIHPPPGLTFPCLSFHLRRKMDRAAVLPAPGEQPGDLCESSWAAEHNGAHSDWMCFTTFCLSGSQGGLHSPSSRTTPF